MINNIDKITGFFNYSSIKDLNKWKIKQILKQHSTILNDITEIKSLYFNEEDNILDIIKFCVGLKTNEFTEHSLYCYQCKKQLKVKNVLANRHFCSSACSCKCEITKEKSKATCLKHFGVENAAQSTQAKEKYKQTCLNKYGVEYAVQSTQVKEKYKQTCLNKYGVENPMQSKEIQEKSKQTCLEKYGVSSALKSLEIKNKIKQTCLEKYGVEYAAQSTQVKEKYKQTCLEKYGVENAFQSTEVKDKIKSTNLKRYGVENPIQSKEIQDKIKQTCLEKYGVEHPMLTIEVKNKIKQTCLEKYGVKHHSKCASVFQHYKNTCLEKYGFDNYELYYAWENIKNLKNIVPLFSKNDFKGISQIYKWKCSLCGNEFYSKYASGNLKRKCDCQKISGISKSELELFDFCKQYFTNIIQHNRQLIKPFELDIVIPELHLAIEFNGIFWHSITIRYTFKLSSNEN